MSHTLTCLDMQLSPITSCLIAWELIALVQKLSCALEMVSTWTCEINIPYLHIRVAVSQFHASYLGGDWVRRYPGSRQENLMRTAERVRVERCPWSNESKSVVG